MASGDAINDYDERSRILDEMDPMRIVTLERSWPNQFPAYGVAMQELDLTDEGIVKALRQSITDNEDMSHEERYVLRKELFARICEATGLIKERKE